ncbi:endonuclease/exonuclease/phosphatase family protein, partial [Candidatus Woesearchaeota archaeon]|nr:endonuclease/exonuclease/phosphatase family protein [Candidatus Woesearchaeota archaeon]
YNNGAINLNIMSTSIISWNVGLGWELANYMPNNWIESLRRGRRIASNNFQDSDMGHVANKIRDEHPDVAFLHELDRDEQLEAVVTALENEYSGELSGVCNDRYSAALVRQGVAYTAERFYVEPLVDTKNGKQPAKGIQRKNIILIRHPDMAIASGKPTAGPLYAPKGIREYEIQQILDYLRTNHNDLPHLIIGDLNMIQTPDGRFTLDRDRQFYERLTEEEGFTDALGRGFSPTGKAWGKGLLILDYAFLGPGLQGEGRVLDTPGTYERKMDHLPIKVTAQPIHSIE